MIKARNIIKSYQNGESRFQVLKDISLDIEDNDFVVILGASGSGKSTFLNVISGLERPDSGKVFYDGKDITALSDNELTSFRKENVGFIFQQYYLLPNMSVDKNVKMGADLANNKDYKNVIRAVGQFVSAEDILHSEGVPVCPVCGGPVKPDVVLYEEGLNQKTLQDAVFYISHADMLIVGGTSLAVYPAAGLIDYYRGNKLVLINKSATPMDARADLLIQDGLGNVFSQIKC
jgi:ABC-type dipeptide/oligopeptide/nickel transport system ATPase component